MSLEQLIYLLDERSQVIDCGALEHNTHVFLLFAKLENYVCLFVFLSKHLYLFWHEKIHLI